MENWLVLIFAVILIICIIKFVKGCVKSLLSLAVFVGVVWWLAVNGFFNKIIEMIH